MQRIVGIGGLLVWLLAGCAGQPYPEVPVEEKGYGVPQSGYSGQVDAEKMSPAPVATAYPDQSQSPISTGAGTPGGQPDSPSAYSTEDRPASVAPPSSSRYAGPPPALLALMEKADRLESQGQTQAALAQLERAQRIAPRDPLVYLQLARLRLHMNDRRRAEQLARRGLSLSGGDPDLELAFRALLIELNR